MMTNSCERTSYLMECRSKPKSLDKGITKSTPHITKTDLKLIGDYFNVNHMMKPQPKTLQHAVQFFIMYFFCRRGEENLFEMTKDHFKIVTEYDGTQYVIQNIDEQDKNHGVKDTEMANQGKMFADPGE